MSKNNRTIKMLLTGLTMGGRVFEAGDLVPEREATHDLKALADGKMHVGKRWAEWVQDPAPKDPVPEQESAKQSEPEAPQEPESTPEATPTETESAPVEPEMPELPPNVTAVDLDDMIKELVRSGMAKGAIVKELGKLETVTQRETSDKFDEMLATGVIVAGENPGEYSVTE